MWYKRFVSELINSSHKSAPAKITDHPQTGYCCCCCRRLYPAQPAFRITSLSFSYTTTHVLIVNKHMHLKMTCLSRNETGAYQQKQPLMRSHDRFVCTSIFRPKTRSCFMCSPNSILHKQERILKNTPIRAQR